MREPAQWRIHAEFDATVRVLGLCASNAVSLPHLISADHADSSTAGRRTSRTHPQAFERLDLSLRVPGGLIAGVVHNRGRIP